MAHESNDRMALEARLSDCRARCRQLRMLTDMLTTVATGGLSVDATRATVARAAQEASGADAAVVEEIDGDETEYTAVTGIGEGTRGMRLSVHASLSGSSFLTGEPLICDDVHTDPRVNQAAARRGSARSALIVPLRHGDSSFGVLKVYSTQPGAFDESHRDLLVQASAVLASALHDAYTHETERYRLRQLVDSLPEMVAYIDRTEIFRNVNGTFAAWLGRSPEELVDRPAAEVLPTNIYRFGRGHVETALSGERLRFETEMVRPHGRRRRTAVEIDYVPHRGANGRVQGVYVIIRDTQDRRHAERDHLTGLYNRRVFESHLDALHGAAQRYGRPLSLLLLDLDHFKQINDRHGHLVGDRILRSVARALQQRTRAADTVCRWGGEEFALLAPETRAEQARQLAEDLLAAIRDLVVEPVPNISASCGVGELQRGENPSELVARVDAALYGAKADGRATVRLAA